MHQASLLDHEAERNRRWFIGTGGWAYYPTRGRKLQKYAEKFNFVEINYTFYEWPDIRAVRTWRAHVPEHFKFSVRCNRDITHTGRLACTPRNLEGMAKMEEICLALGAKLLVLQTPSWFDVTPATLSNVKDLMGSALSGRLRLGWELRTPLVQTTSGLLADFLHEQGIVHVTDLSKTTPLHFSEALYTRLFGHGARTLYQFDDGELRTIRDHANRLLGKETYFVFHSLRMYDDAFRFKHFIETGSFLPITRRRGLASVIRVISDRLAFPISKSELQRLHGWKLFESPQPGRRRVSEVLANLPHEVYENHRQLHDDLARLIEGHSFKG